MGVPRLVFIRIAGAGRYSGMQWHGRGQTQPKRDAWEAVEGQIDCEVNDATNVKALSSDGISEASLSDLLAVKDGKAVTSFQDKPGQILICAILLQPTQFGLSPIPLKARWCGMP